MNRRQFLKNLACAVAAAGGASSRLYAAPERYEGRLLVTVQADGGWDVTSFCDPKENQPGALEITQWSRAAETRAAGNIPYAPFGNNQSFFDRHHRNMLVINGVDAQTNSHTTGVMHNWSGRNAEGYPTLTEMFAAQRAPEIPLSYVNFGGFANSANLIRYSRLDDVYALRNLSNPRQPDENASPWRGQGDMERIRSYQATRLERALGDNRLLPRQRNNLQAYADAMASKGLLEEFADVIPQEDEFTPNVQIGDWQSNLFRQVELTVLAFKSGMASASDLYLGGFDTHTMHDADHEPLLSHLTDGIDYLWRYAEQQGIDDRLTIVIGSDFGRTPHYNADNGKDHWPIGSVIVMEKNAPWGNRVVGLTDEGHNAFRITPHTLQRDDRNGTIIYPKHVHKALRRYLALEDTAVDTNFRFGGTEDFDFFNPALSTT